VLIEKFEHEFYQPGSHSNAVSMLRFLMEQQGLNPIHLQSVLGSEQIVVGILAGDREPSIAHLKTVF